MPVLWHGQGFEQSWFKYLFKRGADVVEITAYQICIPLNAYPFANVPVRVCPVKGLGTTTGAQKCQDVVAFSVGTVGELQGPFLRLRV